MAVVGIIGGIAPPSTIQYYRAVVEMYRARSGGRAKGISAGRGQHFGTPPANNSKFAADGYWALITLTPGEHTLTFGGSFVPVPDQPPAFTTLVTYDLRVTN